MDNENTFKVWVRKPLSEETKKKVKENHSHFWKGKKHSEETKRKMSEAKRGKNCYWHGKELSDEMKKKISEGHIGKHRSLKEREQISKSLKGKKKTGSRTEEYKEKKRIQRLNEIKMKFGGPNFSIKACNFIDKLNQLYGLNLSHALNGGEARIAGYSVDAFDKEQNIVFEYDEPHHYYLSDGALKPKDIRRQERIINRIHPILFLRYDERNGRIYDAISSQNLPTTLIG